MGNGIHRYRLWDGSPFDRERCHAMEYAGGERQCGARSIVRHVQQGQGNEVCVVWLCRYHAMRMEFG